MNYLKNFLSSVVLLLVLGFSLHVMAAEREDLYDLGRSAYVSQDYVAVIKNLYAFYVLNPEYLNNNPSLKETIEQTISECESILSFVIVSNKSMDMSKGKVIIRTDKFDGGFSGTGKQFEDFLKKNSIDLERMMENKKGTLLGQ